MRVFFWNLTKVDHCLTKQAFELFIVALIVFKSSCTETNHFHLFKQFERFDRSTAVTCLNEVFLLAFRFQVNSFDFTIDNSSTLLMHLKLWMHFFATASLTYANDHETLLVYIFFFSLLWSVPHRLDKINMHFLWAAPAFDTDC